MAQTPRILYSPLGNHWYVVTRYTKKTGVDAETGEKVEYLKASIKYDVTDQMTKILKQARAHK